MTAGEGNDSLVDTPTPYGSDTGAGGEVRGNYCTLNPLQNTSVTLSNGNLQATYAPGSWVSAQATMPIPKTGKWKYEVTPTTMTYGFLAIVKPSSALTGTSYNNTNNYAWYLDSGEIRYSGTNLVTVTAASANDICEVRVDNGTVSFYRNGTLQHTFTQLLTDISDDYFPAVYIQSGAVHQYNFGQRPFAYTPSGFKALCTQNLSTPTIGATATTQANKYFDVQTYTGNGTNARVITTNLNEVGLAWVKIRSGVDDHRLANVLTGGNKHLKSNNTDAESTGTTVIQAFSGSTFTIGTDNSVNVNGSTYVAWAWNAGGSNATNTSGTITSTVRANTTSGFSIVTYTGTGSNATVGHGLGVAPSMVIVKIRSTTGYWTVQHSALGSGYYGYLNFTNSFDTANANLRWNGTNPSSTVFAADSIEIKPVKLLLEHDRTRPIGKMVSHNVTKSGIEATFKIANTMAGEDALIEATEGLRDGFSVGAQISEWTNNKGVMQITSATLDEVSLVTDPAIDSARVSEVAASENPIYFVLGELSVVLRAQGKPIPSLNL